MTIFMFLFALCAVVGVATLFDRKMTRPSCRNKAVNVCIGDLYLILCMVLLFLICAFRSIGVGVDTDNYVIMFWHPEILEETIGGNTKYELGYVFFVKFLRLFGNSALIYLIGTSVVIFAGMYLFIRNNCKGNYAIALMVYVAFLYYIGFSAIRQAMAVSIAINCVYFLKKRKWIPAALIIVLGGLFHTIALLMLVIIPFAFTAWSKKKVIIAAVIAVLGVLLFDPLLKLVVKIFPIYQRYLESEMIEGEGGIGVFALLVIILSVFAATMLFTNKTKFERKDQEGEFVLALVGSIFTIAINLVGRKYGILSRTTRYFIPFVMILAADVYQCCIPNDYKFLRKFKITGVCDRLAKYHITPKLLFYVAVAGMMGIYFYTIMKGNLYGILPYSFYSE